MRRVLTVFPWVLLVVVIIGFWQLREQWRQHPETLAMTNSELVMSQAPGTVASYHSAVKVAAPAVVNIYTTQKVRAHSQIDDPVLRRFFEFHQDGDQLNNGQNDAAQPTSLGSGVIATSDGYILTNNHVVAQADKIIVALQDGRRAVATVIGTDPDSDLAVIKVNLTGLPVLPFCKNPTEVGDIVLAIGNPFGVGQTVTHGIVSAIGRSGLGINAFEDFIQTDAAINPGNSGGALIDVAGNLVGVNTAIFSRTGGSMGIGFAIPANLAQQVMLDIVQSGKVTRGWLGIQVRNQEDPTEGVESGVSSGVRIVGTLKNGPADRGGLQSNDVILTVNNEAVSTAGQLIQKVAAQKPNSKVNLLVKRGEQQVKLAVAIGERPAAEIKTTSNEDSTNRGDPSLFGLFSGQ
ncbi:MAG: trypsin-like peptidase domain-containing protein [Candidatus Saccharibacteria bacterium]|nr:trypsin-like peptidase domain-containing protein [Moraxellaceae bacterium]